MKSQKQCAEYLIQAGADPSAHTFCVSFFTFLSHFFLYFFIHREPIHCAARLGCLSMIEFLVSQGVNINAQTTDGILIIIIDRTPLYEVTSAMEDDQKKDWRLQAVSLLLKYNADPSIPDLSGRTPLHWACYYGCDKIAHLLIPKSNVRAQDDEGVTPLHLSSYAGNLDISQCLVQNGADISALDFHLRTPLHYAARNGNRNLIDFLLLNKANPDAVDDSGDTPPNLLEGAHANENQEAMQRMSDQNKQKLKLKNPSTSSLHC